jgi:uncharacterized membrane protein YhaH (DUF805 family)
MSIWDHINPDGKTSIEHYRLISLAVVLAAIPFVARDLWLPDSDMFEMLAFAAAFIVYAVYWCITVRRLRDCGQSTLFGWCFLFGGAIIPIFIGIAMDTQSEDEVNSVR